MVRAPRVMLPLAAHGELVHGGVVLAGQVAGAAVGGRGVPGGLRGGLDRGVVPAGVVVAAVLVEKRLEPGQGGGGRAGGEPPLEGLVVASGLAAGLRVVGAGVDEPGAQAGHGAGELALAAGQAAGEGGAVVAQHDPGRAVRGRGGGDRGHGRGGGPGVRGVAGGQQPGAVIEHVEDHRRLPAGELDLGRADLVAVPGPGVGEPAERGPRPLAAAPSLTRPARS